MLLADGTNVYLNEQRDIRNNFKIITNPTNFGFAKANNQAAAKALGKYLVTLNNDTLVKPGWLESLKKTVESDPTVAAAGSKLIYPDMTIQHAGVVIVNNRGDENPLVAIHIHSKKPSDFPEANKTRTFKALTAACLLIKKNAFEEAGGFDEEYYNGYEDVDLCFKLGEIGYKLVYQPESEVIHYESQSGRERFVKITHNVERLNKKWHNKIVADYWTDENKTLIPLKENKIACDNNETKEPEVSIIILSFSQLEYTKQFIESVFHFTKASFELILIDNGSNKDTVDYLKSVEEKEKRIKTIFNEKNLGFPKAVNQGIKAAAANYILIANNDIVVTEGWLERMLEVAESDNKIGIVGPISNAVSGVQLDKEAKYSNLEEMHRYSEQVKQLHSGQTLEFPRVAFLCTLIKKKSYRKNRRIGRKIFSGKF